MLTRSRLILCTLLWPYAAFGATTAPELRIEAPPELAGVATRLAEVDAEKLIGIAEIVGLERPGPPIRVVLAAEDSEAARAAPEWVSGYAYGNLGVIVLFPERTPSYPDSSLTELLRHEVAHVLIDRAAGGRAVPRWFHEGVATLAADVWRLSDRSRFAISMVRGGETTLAEIESEFGGERRQVAEAYALASAFVRDVALRYRAGAPAEILRLVALGQPFDEAFFRATGRTLEQAERSFWRRNAFWYRWFPVVSSSITGWTLITLLFLLAAWRKRRQTAELRRRWDEEERWLGEMEAEEQVASFEAPTRPN